MYQEVHLELSAFCFFKTFCNSVSATNLITEFIHHLHDIRCVLNSIGLNATQVTCLQ